MVMGDTVQRPGGDAAVVRVHGTQKGLAVTCDVTPRYVAADPEMGTKQAVVETWRNLTAVGADPIAITDNMNFANPERPEVMGQFVASIRGMGEACRVLDYPVVSGNVSLYNETNGVGIPPTPAIGAVGLVPDIAQMADIRLEARGRPPDRDRPRAGLARPVALSADHRRQARRRAAARRSRRRDQGRAPRSKPDPRRKSRGRARHLGRRASGRDLRDGACGRSKRRGHGRRALPLRGQAAGARHLVRRGPGPLRARGRAAAWRRRWSSARACSRCRRASSDERAANPSRSRASRRYRWRICARFIERWLPEYMGG